MLVPGNAVFRNKRSFYVSLSLFVTMTSLKNGKKHIDRLRQRLFMLKISTLQLLSCLEYVIESKYANFIQ